MIGIFPVSQRMRERVQRRQSEDEPGWDAPIPAGYENRRVIPLNDSRDDLPKRDQSTTTNAAKPPVVVLLMPLHDYLTDDPLVSCPSTMTGQDDDGKKADV